MIASRSSKLHFPEGLFLVAKKRKRKESSLYWQTFVPLQATSRSRSISNLSSKAQTYTPGKKAKTPCKSPKKSPQKSPKKFGLSPRGDRFIPTRPLVDCEWSHFQIMQGSEAADACCDMEVEGNSEYQTTLAENLGHDPGRSKILHFKSGAPVTNEGFVH